MYWDKNMCFLGVFNFLFNYNWVYLCFVCSKKAKKRAMVKLTTPQYYLGLFYHNTIRVKNIGNISQPLPYGPIKNAYIQLLKNLLSNHDPVLRWTGQG